MKILMLTSESVPFAKTGGLADAVPALASALAGRGHDVRILMPRYYGIDRSYLEKLPAPLGIPMGKEEYWCAVNTAVLPKNGVKIYFLDREDLFGREGLYGPDGSHSWPDNALRFAFLSSAAFQLARHLDWRPDIFHAHDWQAAPATWMLSTRERFRDFGNTASVITIHNLGYQGIFPASDIRVFSPDYLKRTEGVFKDSHLNFLAAGIAHADEITTVSPTYAQEIREPDFSEDLGDLLNSRAKDITGILNGMDYDEWNPADDATLNPDNYDVDKMAGKKKLKTRLQKEMGLPADPDIPLFGMITRLTGQKGIDLIANPSCPNSGPIADILKSGQAQLAVLGTGESRFEKPLLQLSEGIPNVAARIAFSGPISRLIEAGSDFFLMPSRYEPCGLNQMYSLRYGTPPVVRETGGLADTVIDLTANPKNGNGFVFKAAKPEALADAMKRAIAFFRDEKAMAAARCRGMKLKFDWKRSAALYESIFERALEKVAANKTNS